MTVLTSHGEAVDQLNKSLEENEGLREALKKLVHAVKTYQFTPDGSAEKALSAADMDDALDEAKALLS